MRTITGDHLRLLLQPHVVCLSGFRNPRAPLSAEVVHSKFVDGLYKEQQLLADKFNVNILPVQGNSREPYTMLNSQSSACELSIRLFSRLFGSTVY